MVAAVAIAMAFVLASRSANAIDVVETWIEARNEGDITALMEMLSSDGVIFEFPMSIQSRRQMLETLFRSQVVAGHHIEESSCRAEGEIVRCRYVMNDAFTRTVGASLTGEHLCHQSWAHPQCHEDP